MSINVAAIKPSIRPRHWVSSLSDGSWCAEQGSGACSMRMTWALLSQLQRRTCRRRRRARWLIGCKSSLRRYRAGFRCKRRRWTSFKRSSRCDCRSRKVSVYCAIRCYRKKATGRISMLHVRPVAGRSGGRSSQGSGGSRVGGCTEVRTGVPDGTHFGAHTEPAQPKLRAVDSVDLHLRDWRFSLVLLTTSSSESAAPRSVKAPWSCLSHHPTHSK